MNERPCKNCKKFSNKHVELYTPDDHPVGLRCTITLDIKKTLMKLGRPVWTMAFYEPMNNLEYLEWKSAQRD